MSSPRFDNSYSRLPDRFYARIAPTPVVAPRLISLNRPLAHELDLDPDWLEGSEGVAMLAGTHVPAFADPLAAAYAGHQFGHFVPQLGDGRAVLLCEVVTPDGSRRDLQLKGAGPTPFSRRGDGRAALGPVLREYLVSEAMAALGIPTTRALAAVLTGETVRREALLPGAVLTRVAASHIRVGTFQYFAARGDHEALGTLADYVIARHYPDARAAENPYRSLLDHVVARQADLIARWLLVGFIHGVMNTDNMSIAGETIDYGPCAFMDSYDPAAVYSSIDEQGRYAYGNQPRIGLWNLFRLAEAMLPLLSDRQERALAEGQEALDAFLPQFEATYTAGLRRKLGLLTDKDDDLALAEELLGVMKAGSADFTLTFRRLGEAALGPAHDGAVRTLFSNQSDFDRWAAKWRNRIEGEPMDGIARRTAMRAVNPAFVPRNHRVEAALAAAIGREDFGPFHTLMAVLSKPYEDQPAFAPYAEPPAVHEVVHETFCGT